jgi:hypothetical protein
LAATDAKSNGTSNAVAMDNVGFVLLAGGKGSQM